MGYLICDTCHGYYELKDGESPEDFSSKCECGGNLEYKDSINYSQETKSEGRDKIAYGYSFADEKSFKYKIITILGIAILFIGILGLITFNLIGLILTILGCFIFYTGYNRGYSWIKGDKGEKIVSGYLEDLPRGYFVFNNVKIPKGKGDYDHIVIGPTGIFLIETKNYSGSFKIEGDNWFKGYSSHKFRKKPGNQAKVNAWDLSKFINKNLGKKIWVNAVVTLLNEDFKVVKKPKYYSVVYAGNLTKYILNYKNNLNKKAINKIVYLMQDYCTEIFYKKEDVEFE